MGISNYKLNYYSYMAGELNYPGYMGREGKCFARGA